MSRWPESKTIKFIRLYKKNRCLWDPKLIEYKNKVLREKACQNIIQEMQAKDCATVHDVKLKIKNLRSTYHQEVKKVRESLASGDRSHDKPTLSWFYELHSFIGCIKADKSLSSVIESIDQSSDVIQIDAQTDSNTDPIDEVFETESISESIKQENSIAGLEVEPDEYSEPEQQIVESPPSKKRKRDKQTNPIHYSERTTVNSNKTEDEFYYFALNVAAQLRQMPLHEALQMQVVIQNKLLSARTKVLKPVKIRREDYEESDEDSD